MTGGIAEKNRAGKVPGEHRHDGQHSTRCAPAGDRRVRRQPGQRQRQNRRREIRNRQPPNYGISQPHGHRRG
jgi:hypothetical protein